MKHRSVEGSTDGSPTASGWGNFSLMADGPEGSTATSTSEEGLENRKMGDRVEIVAEQRQ